MNGVVRSVYWLAPTWRRPATFDCPELSPGILMLLLPHAPSLSALGRMMMNSPSGSAGSIRTTRSHWLDDDPDSGMEPAGMTSNTVKNSRP